MKNNLILLVLSLFGFQQIHAESPYHFNQNYQIHEYIKDGSATFVYWITTANGSMRRKTNCKLKLEELPEKDIEGYSNYKILLIAPKDSITLVSVSPHYPMVYQMVTHTNYADRTNYDFAPYIKSGYYYPYFLVLNGSKMQSVGVKIAQDVISFSGKSAPTCFGIGKEEGKVHDNYISLSGSGGEFDSYDDFAEAFGVRAAQVSSGFGTSFAATEYPGMESHYNATKKYQDTLLYDAKQKKNNGLLSEFADGDYIYYRKGSSNLDGSPVRLKFGKNGDKIEKITLQETFTDGQFYDKEKFFFDFPLESDGLVHNRLRCQSNTYGADLILIPLANRIVILENKNKYISGVISPYEDDYVANNLCLHKRLCLFGTSEQWWCKTNLEEYYLPEKDPCLFSNFLTQYLEALK